MVGTQHTHNHGVGKLDRVYLGILLVIFGGIVLQAPISVGLGALFPHDNLVIKAWAEILMAIASVLAIIILVRQHKTALLKEPLMVGIGIYGLIYVATLLIFRLNDTALAAGFVIDLRYILFFVLVFIAMRLYPDSRIRFIKIGAVGGLIVMIFALLQVFILPADILRYIGYNVNTIAPYLTVDQNHAFIRINSTLRGPNPLGAYAVIMLALLVAFLALGKRKIFTRPVLPVAILLIGSVVALWVSYSRSALVGAVIAIGVVLGAVIHNKLSRKSWIIGAIIVLLGLGAVAMTGHTSFFSNIFLHENPNGGSSTNSNQGHLSSLQNGLDQFLVEPFGAGVGSTGSASFSTNNPLIIENQYLFIAHEVGWLGLVLFIMIFIGVMARLWQWRRDWLALGVFASGIGLAFIGLVLPVWVDDTVSIVWWGLAAIAIGGRHE
jgi:hypothetical protein